MDEQFTIGPLSPETWDALAGLVERHHGIFGGCRCVWFHPDCAGRGQGHGGGRAVARCGYGTPEELPDVHHRTRASERA